ncbi:hypothetical protein CCMA1212_003574 [Trichoderma ghanense]|uniref:Uncharacterized protein n=1 Tax=Trichoderma ghanense TaxID=65468 RepID=A0ABY2HAW7_9HYPO
MSYKLCCPSPASSALARSLLRLSSSSSRCTASHSTPFFARGSLVTEATASSFESLSAPLLIVPPETKRPDMMALNDPYQTEAWQFGSM